MRYRRMDENGDYVFGNGKNDFLEGTKAFAQAVSTKLNLFKSEWFEDITDGLPFYQEIAGTFITDEPEIINLVTQKYFDRMGKVPGFVEVENYEESFDSSARKYSLSAKISSEYGTVNIKV